MALLEVRDLAVEFTLGDGRVARAVDGISFDVDAGEAVVLLLVTSAVLASVVLNWGHPAMLLGPLLGTAAAIGWGIFLRQHDHRCEAAHMSAQEERAWKILERDPSATVALEQLAAIMEREGRHESLLGVLQQWHSKEPDNRRVQRRIGETRARLGLEPEGAAAETSLHG